MGVKNEFRYVSVKELEEAFKSNKLFSLLKSLSDAELTMARANIERDDIECDDILGIRNDILVAINYEQSYRKVTITNLETAYKNNDLNELLKLLSDAELTIARANIERDDILGIRREIFLSILQEQMSRTQGQTIIKR